MTNTPMTSREAFALHCVEQKPKGYWVSEGDFEAGWQASQAQQAQTIADLVEALERLDSALLINHNAQTGAFLNMNELELIKKAIAKVKGK